jgi:hypothetical protein
MVFKDQFYAVVAQHRGYSNRDGSAMTTITMWGVEDGLTYTTYVVDDYRNSQNWGYIVRNPDRGFLIKFFNGKLSKELQINADSVPQLQDQLESAQALKDVCRKVWAEQNTPTTKSKVTKEQVLAQADKLAEMVKDLFE